MSTANRRPFTVFVNEASDHTGASYDLMRDSGLNVVMGRAGWDEPGRPMTEDELIEAARDADALLGVSRDSYPRRLMEQCRRLRIISKVGVGTEKIDVAAATELGVLVGFTPIPENTKPVAEHAVTLMSALLRTLPDLERHLRGGGWRGPRIQPRSMFGKTVGLIGLGRIGKEAARRLAGWDVTILAADPYITAEEAAASHARLVPLDELLASADIISLHVVVTPETRNMLGAAQFARMRDGAIVVNTSRGQVIDEDALADALQEGKVKAAGLDVFQSEPPDLRHRLFSLPNVIVTPHAAGFAGESVSANATAAARNVIAAARGEDPPYVKNPEALPRWRERWSAPVESGDQRGAV